MKSTRISSAEATSTIAEITGESEPRPPKIIAPIEMTTAPRTMNESGRIQRTVSLLQAKPAAPMPRTTATVRTAALVTALGWVWM